MNTILLVKAKFFLKTPLPPWGEGKGEGINDENLEKTKLLLLLKPSKKGI